MEEVVEDFLATGLAFVGGVVALAAQRWFELDGGDEEVAGLADRFEVAVDLDGSGAVAVAEHALVHLGAEFAYFGLRHWRGVGGVGCRGLDFVGDGVRTWCIIGSLFTRVLLWGIL